MGPFLLLGNFATNEWVPSAAWSFVSGEVLVSETVRRFCIPQGTYIPPHLVSVSLSLVSVGFEDPEGGSEHSSERVCFSQGIQSHFHAEFPIRGSRGWCTKYLSTAFSSAGPDMSGEGWPCSGLQTAIQVTCARTPSIFHLTLHRVHNLLLPWLAICTAGTAPLPLSWSLSSDLLNIYCSGQKGFYFTYVQYLVGWSLGLHWDFWVLW